MEMNVERFQSSSQQFALTDANCRALQSAVARCSARPTSIWMYIRQWRTVLLVVVVLQGCASSEREQTRFRIASASMAPKLFGPHFLATCSQCGDQHKIACEAFEARIATRCVRCGAVCQVNSTEMAGDIVSLDRSVNQVERFDVIAFGQSGSDQKGTIDSVKRVWALPDEEIELREGEAWIDGAMLRKTTRQFAEVSVPLSNSALDDPSGWSIRKTIDQASVSTVSKNKDNVLILQPDHQLEFDYQRSVRNTQEHTFSSSSLVDDYPCNQNSVATLHPVTDYLVGLELAHPMTAVWHMELMVGARRVDLGFAEASYADDQVVAIDFEKHFLVGVCDGRILVCTPRREWSFEPEELPDARVTSSSLITIQSSQPMHFTRLVVARDLWLGPREQRATTWEEDKSSQRSGYFVLGDNLPLSLDSRDPSVGRIDPACVTGKVREDQQRDWILAFLDRCSQ